MTPVADFEDIQLESPAKIVPAVPKTPPSLPPRDDISPAKVPELPPRSPIELTPVHRVLQADDEPPELPSRTPRSPYSALSPRSLRVREPSERKIETQEETINYDTTSYLIVNQAKLMLQYKKFLQTQDLYQDSSVIDIANRLEPFKSDIDYEFWKFFLFNQGDIPTVKDLTLLRKIEYEFSILEAKGLRQLAYLVLSHATNFSDQLFQDVIVDLTAEQDFELQELKLSPDLKDVVLKITTIDSLIPNTIVIELARLLLKFSDLKAADVFKILICINFQVKDKLLSPKKEMFLFQLSRALEDNCPKFVLLLASCASKIDPFQKLYELIQDSILWQTMFDSVEEETTALKLLDSFLLKGLETIITVLVKLIKSQELYLVTLLVKEGYDSFSQFVVSPECLAVFNDKVLYESKESIQLYKYEKEYEVIINQESVLYPRRAEERFARAHHSHAKLMNLKSELETQYNQILSNYQQLNEEKFTNETFIKPLMNKKNDLINQNRELFNEYEHKSRSLEVLKTSNERNEEIDQSNELLNEHIKEVTEQIAELKLKIDEVKGSK